MADHAIIFVVDPPSLLIESITLVASVTRLRWYDYGSI